jgi:hypothetical protein
MDVITKVAYLGQLAKRTDDEDISKLFNELQQDLIELSRLKSEKFKFKKHFKVQSENIRLALDSLADSIDNFID